MNQSEVLAVKMISTSDCLLKGINKMNVLLLKQLVSYPHVLLSLEFILSPYNF